MIAPALSPTATLKAVLLAVLLSAVLLAGLGLVGYVVYLRWQASKAEAAVATAVIAQGNADSANAGAANATTTRAAIDAATVDLRITTEQSARRIENASPVDPGHPADPAILFELELAEDQARAAADRLQRKSSR